MTRRKLLPLLLILLGLVLLLFSFQQDKSISNLSNEDSSWFKLQKQQDNIGDVIMGKMGNETIKAELGRASWKLLHTMAAKFPFYPTQDQKDALKNFIHLFSRLYPCGECAGHFQLVLKDNPPDVNGREQITQWACKVHNIVNERLKKPIFDCKTINDFYKCGCEDDKE